MDYSRTAHVDVKTTQCQVDILPLPFVLHQDFKVSVTNVPVLANSADARPVGRSVGATELYCVYRI